MSRLGKKPVPVPAGVKVTLTATEVRAKGPKGELAMKVKSGVNIRLSADGQQVELDRADDTKELKALHGTYRAQMANLLVGVTQGYESRLRIVGTGYRVELQGKKLTIHAGYGHPVVYEAPAGIDLELPKSPSREYMDFIVRGIDKQMVNEVAAQIRRVRPPNPYKGKGIRYADEQVRLLEGKSLGK